MVNKAVIDRLFVYRSNVLSVVLREYTMRSLLVCASLLLGACQHPLPLEGETLYINHRLVDCVGVGPMQCMQVRTDQQQAWTLFYQQIEGFRFEPGYRYQLLVDRVPHNDAPADAPAIHYRLLKVISKVASP